MTADRHVPGMVIPLHQLPPGFAETLAQVPAEPATARPAATAVLLRDSASGPELLLLQRHRNSGFVPGAYVFPGGRVDAADDEARLRERVTHVHASEPPLAYWFAAVREVFEETGVLLARDAHGHVAPDAHADAYLADAREALLTDRATLLDVLSAGNYTADLAGLVYFAHWITPVVEPRRFDTRFFLAALPAGQLASPDAREMSDAVWLTPAAALERFAAGTLPMVFPTVRTIESLAGYASVPEMLRAFEQREVHPILPRLVRTEAGVELVVDPEET